jgi:phosphonate transport system substrate-binding protein
MASIEPELTSKTEIVAKSEPLGFPPVACLRSQAGLQEVAVIHEALVSMASDAEGRDVLSLLKLDGFADEPDSLFDSIASKVELVKGLG